VVQRLLRQVSDFVRAQPLGSMAVFLAAGLLAPPIDRQRFAPFSADCGGARRHEAGTGDDGKRCG
jgi:hypothetical protein